MAHNTVSVSGRMPIPLRDLLNRVADRRNTTVSKLLHRAACDLVADEFGLTSGDGLQAAEHLRETT